ncbi:MAG TPA: ECF-type sigma factor [Gemmatimonadaceae bacterium]|nr:ECF-type sigma factor [Gemmatimonadaceae bacterium]
MESDVRSLIEQADRADPVAADALFTMLYAELHRLAESSLRRAGASITLGATTLLHEAYLNMAGREGVAYPDQARFLGYASHAMRGLIIDYTRRRRAQKRGRELEITLEGEVAQLTDSMRDVEELEELGDALDELATLEPSLAELVDMHFFCGFTFAEISALRSVSERTVRRDWRKARLLLHRALLSGD